MGIVFQTNRALVRDYAEETAVIKDILIEPGRPESQVKLAPLSSLEVDRILRKLDTLCMQVKSPAIATMLAEETQAILVAVRLCKVETHESFMGILSAGSNLDIAWLRAIHVGSSLMNSVGTASCGVCQQANCTDTWLFSHTAATEINLIPSQTMQEEACVIHLGAINPIDVPKLDAIRVDIAGIPTPAQSLEYRLRKTFEEHETPLVRFEKPVIIGPEKRQLIRVYPYLTGNDKTQLISLIIARAEDLLLTVTSA